MKKNIIIIALFVINVLNAQTNTTPPVAKEWDISFYGFIRTDYIVDTRKTAQVRELNLDLYPLDESKLADGSDQNANAQSNYLSIVSRAGTKVKGPDVWGAKISGTLEGDFFGNTQNSSTSSIGLLRLRHAFVQMDWSKTSLTLGQTWYPAFIPEVFPGVANFNTGILFNPFGWATQARLKYSFSKDFSGTIVAYKEREFTTIEATGQAQNSATINSVLPTLHGQLQYKKANWIAGVAGEYKSIQPLLVSNGKASSEKVNSFMVMSYAKYSNDKFSVKLYGISGGDLSSFVMLGGYAGYTPSSTEVETYKPIKTTAFWFDVASNHKKVAPALFFGYTKVNGADKDGATAYYSRGISGNRAIDNIWRVSGRVDFKQNKFRVTPEIEYTTAKWGDLSASKNATIDTNPVNVSNLRIMASCAYSF